MASFYSWQPYVPGDLLVDRINQQLQAQWEAAGAGAAAAGHAVNHSAEKEQPRHEGGGSFNVSATVQQAPVCPLRVWRAELVPRQFHPTFAAKWRRYVYLLPLRSSQSSGML